MSFTSITNLDASTLSNWAEINTIKWKPLKDFKNVPPSTLSAKISARSVDTFENLEKLHQQFKVESKLKRAEEEYNAKTFAQLSEQTTKLVIKIEEWIDNCFLTIQEQKELTSDKMRICKDFLVQHEANTEYYRTQSTSLIEDEKLIKSLKVDLNKLSSQLKVEEPASISEALKQEILEIKHEIQEIEKAIDFQNTQPSAVQKVVDHTKEIVQDLNQDLERSQILLKFKELLLDALEGYSDRSVAEEQFNATLAVKLKTQLVELNNLNNIVLSAVKKLEEKNPLVDRLKIVVQSIEKAEKKAEKELAQALKKEAQEAKKAKN
ncbi:MAG: hypothetical protein K0S74_1732 [Chlamydiales bacterium]|jgi:hypothetical protein|nr:hypothetical protein [Chlamydiales bacterium]